METTTARPRRPRRFALIIQHYGQPERILTDGYDVDKLARMARILNDAGLYTLLRECPVAVPES